MKVNGKVNIPIYKKEEDCNEYKTASTEIQQIIKTAKKAWEDFEKKCDRAMKTTKNYFTAQLTGTGYSNGYGGTKKLTELLNDIIKETRYRKSGKINYINIQKESCETLLTLQGNNTDAYAIQSTNLNTRKKTSRPNRRNSGKITAWVQNGYKYARLNIRNKTNGRKINPRRKAVQLCFLHLQKAFA